MQTKNPTETYSEMKREERAEEYIEPIDSLPHKDWLRAT